MRLTEPQERHLREMVSPDGKTLYWRPSSAGERRCALALKKLGLLAGNDASYSRAFYLTDAGMAAALAVLRPGGAAPVSTNEEG